jgi:toxin ParE1/3/4
MPLTLRQSRFFLADVEAQFRWYLTEAGPEVAQRYRLAVQATLARLIELPDIGRLRFADDPELIGLRSCTAIKPFNRQLLFYRVVGETLIAERTIHGARDLPRRLKEPPR